MQLKLILLHDPRSKFEINRSADQQKNTPQTVTILRDCAEYQHYR